MNAPLRAICAYRVVVLLTAICLPALLTGCGGNSVAQTSEGPKNSVESKQPQEQQKPIIWSYNVVRISVDCTAAEMDKEFNRQGRMGFEYAGPIGRDNSVDMNLYVAFKRRN